MVSGWVDVYRYNGDVVEGREWRRYWAEASDKMLSFRINETAPRRAHITYSSITNIVGDTSELPVDTEARHVIGLHAGKEWVILSVTAEDKPRWSQYLVQRLSSTVSRSPCHAPSPVISPVTPACTTKHSSPPQLPVLDGIHEQNIMEILQQYKKLLRGKITREGLQDLLALERDSSEEAKLRERVTALEQDQDSLLKEFEQVHSSRKDLVTEHEELRRQYERLNADHTKLLSQQAEAEATIASLHSEVSRLGTLCVQGVKWKDDIEPEPYPSQPPVPTATSPGLPPRHHPVSPQSSALSGAQRSPQQRHVSPQRSVSPSGSPALVLSPPPALLPTGTPPLAPLPLPKQKYESPRTFPVTCHICGNHFLDSLQSHIPKCLKNWFSTQKQLPRECRRLRPPTAPSISPSDTQEYNKAATEVYLTQAKNRCTFCLQRFDGGVVLEHMASCAARR